MPLTLGKSRCQYRLNNIRIQRDKSATDATGEACRWERHQDGSLCQKGSLDTAPVWPYSLVRHVRQFDWRLPMQTKLTLRLDEDLIRRAKSSAKRRGKSVSQIVADYLASIEEKPRKRGLELTPVVRSLKGALRGAHLDIEDYRRYLEEKYS